MVTKLNVVDTEKCPSRPMWLISFQRLRTRVWKALGVPAGGLGPAPAPRGAGPLTPLGAHQLFLTSPSLRLLCPLHVATVPLTAETAQVTSLSPRPHSLHLSPHHVLLLSVPYSLGQGPGLGSVLTAMPSAQWNTAKKTNKWIKLFFFSNWELEPKGWPLALLLQVCCSEQQKLVRNAGSQAPRQAHWTTIFVLTRSPENSHAH